MEKITVFTHKLDLALRPVDTTSGLPVHDRDLAVYLNGDRVRGEPKGGLLIFQNLPCRRFRLELRSPQYEAEEREVDLDAMPSGLPLLELHLIPSAGYAGGAEFLTIEGVRPGVSALSAVRAGDNACMIREFDPRKRLMKLFNPHHLSLDRLFYALVDPDNGSYELFRILKMTDDQTAKTDRVIETEFRNYFPITPVVLGKCDPDGRCCLRVRDNGGEANWIVRWEENGTAHFRTMDLRRETELPAKGGG